MRTWRVARPWVADAPDRAAGDSNTPVTFSLQRNFGATRRPGAVQPASSVPVWVSCHRLGDASLPTGSSRRQTADGVLILCLAVGLRLACRVHSRSRPRKQTLLLKQPQVLFKHDLGVDYLMEPGLHDLDRG